MLPPEPWAWVLVGPRFPLVCHFVFLSEPTIACRVGRGPGRIWDVPGGRAAGLQGHRHGGREHEAQESLALWSFVFKSVTWTVRLDGLSRPMHLWILRLNTSHLLGMGPGKDLSVCLVGEG